MSVENLSLNENSAYVGASVTFRGDLIASDTVIVEGTVEGNVTAGSVFVGTNGAIKGSLSAADAEIKGLLSESAVIKGFLHLRSTGRVARSAAAISRLKEARRRIYCWQFPRAPRRGGRFG
jgi:cytoskeletal protein CcmA (bactofilin family)